MNPRKDSIQAAVLSHDLKTPLTGITMMLALLGEEKVGPLNERQRFMVSEAIKDCKRLEDVIRKHLDACLDGESLSEST